jgi:DNA-directed RNA polymerase specialized sigma24 family protein
MTYMNLTNEDLTQLLHESDRKRQELIDRCHHRDRQAFNQFIQNYQDDIFSHVYQMMGKKEEAFEITRDVFVTAYKSFSTFHGETSVEVWLFKIAERYIQATLCARKKWYKRIFPVPTSGQHQETTEPEKYPDQECTSEEPDELLIAYIDGELSEFESKRVEKLLEEDGDYRQEYEELQKIDTLLQFFKRTSAPVDLRVHINAKLDEKSFWEKVHDAIEIFHRKTPERRSISPTSMIYPLLTRGSDKTEHVSQTLEEIHEPDPMREKRRQAEAKYDKADFYKKHGKHEKAIQLFEEALELYQNIEHPEGQILAHHQLALLYKEVGKTDETVQHAQEFLKRYQDLKIVKKYEQIQKLLKEIQ